jgi:hypothetical protein
MVKNKRITAALIFSVFLFLPISLQAREHPMLMLKSTTTKKVYLVKPNMNGTFTFQSVKPGTYSLSIIATKPFFDAKLNDTASIVLSDLEWWTAGNKAAKTTFMTLPSMTITSAMFAKTVPSDIKSREYSIILSPALTTASRANLSGMISNFNVEY